MKHVVVVASSAAYDAVLRRLGRDLTLVEGWTGGAGSVCTGAIRDARDAAAAVGAAAGGATIVAAAPPAGALTESLVDDLRRLGGVEVVEGEPASGPDLTPEERAVLVHLAEGRTLGEVAAALHISRRTADRRLAAARAKLGAGSTAEAVVRFGERP